MRLDGFIEKYGIGMSLYFKFLKTVTIAFFIASCFAIFPIFYFWTGSGWDAEAKATYIEQGGMPYVFFYTTAGSLRGQSYVCGSAFEGERLNLECENGVIQSIEAYYGTPEGSCTCPPEQSIVPSTGECPGDISFKDVSYGECRDSTNAPQYLRKGHDVKPCFKGEMWNGDECCAYGVKLYIQWPLYAQEDQPIQFHLPVVCKHHYQNEKGGKLAPNCCLVKPSDSDLSTGGKDYQTKMGQQGWVQLFSPLDDHGLGKLPPHRSPLDRILGRDPLRKPKKLKNGKKKNSFFMAAFAGNDEKEDALAKDVDDTDSDDSESDASDIEEDDDADEKRMKKKYRPFYDNFRHHRVWYQVMAFAPKPIVKDFTKLEEFVHELESFHSDSAILTLPPGNLVGERIECVIHTQRGVLHNQRQVAHIPGVGDLNVTILASNGP